MKNIRMVLALMLISLLGVGAGAEGLRGTIFESNYPVEAFSRGDASQFVMLEQGLIVLDTQNEYLSFQNLSGGEAASRSSVIEEADGKRCIWGIAERDGALLAVEASFTDGAERKYREVALYEVPMQTGSQFEQEKLCELNWFDVCEEDEQIEALAALSDALIVVTDGQRAIRFDLPGGAGERIEGEGYIDVLRMEDARVALAQATENGVLLSAYETGSGAVSATKQLGAEASGFAAKDGEIYYCENYSLYRTALAEDAAPEAVTNLQVETGGRALIVGDSYLLGVMSAVRAFDMNAVSDQQVTIYYDMMDSSVLDSFAQENPDIELRKDRSRGWNSILTDLLTENRTVDVYVLSSAESSTFRTIRNRGYAMPLESEVIRAHVEQLYPQIQSEVMVDGNIYGAPIAMRVQMSALGVNLKLWDRLGLSRDELPQSWRELMDFITERWPSMQEDALDAGFCLMDKGEYETLPTVFVNHRESQRPEKGESVFATPDIIYNYERYQYGLLHQVYAPEDFHGPSLFAVFNIEPMMNMGSDYTLLPLTLDGKPTAPVATMEVMVVNPYSEHIETALKLIEYCTQHMRPQDAIEMMPENNAPLERSGYGEDLRKHEETIAMYDARIAGAQEEADRRMLEDQKAQFVLRNTEDLESTRWSISEASIRAYREYMQDFCITYTFVADEAEGRKLDDLHNKFDAGAIDAQTYATSLDRAIRMSEMEDE